MIRADMHVHTYYSDGEMAPAELIRRAKANGLDMLVITDHDTMRACAESLPLCAEQGLKTVKGTEISAYDGDVKVHILAYGLDENSAAYRDFYKKCMEGAELRIRDILKKLQAVGVYIPFEEVEAERHCPEVPLHSSLVARAGAKRGYCASSGAFFMKYLNYGTDGFSCLHRPDPEYAVEMIHAAGGICSLAHPGRIWLDESGFLSLLKRLLGRGLDGIEAVYSGHTMGETAYYKEIAQKYNLLVTGGSDTHYPTGSRAVGTPEFYPDEALLSALGLI